MNTPTPVPPNDKRFSRRVARTLGGPAGWRGLRVGWIIAAVPAVTLVAFVAVFVIPGLTAEDSGPDWDEPRTLSKAEPVWKYGIDSSDTVVVHEDVLARSTENDDGDTVTIHDLSTGEDLMSTHPETSGAWLSEDGLIADEPDGVAVYDFRTGDKVRTIEVADESFQSVASETLISIESDGETAARMRAVDVATGTEQWTKDLNASWLKINVDTPSSEPNYEPFTTPDVAPESTSPIVLLDHRKEPSDPLWEQVDAIDVATGEKLWSSPIDYGGMTDPEEFGIRLTDSGDVYTQITDQADGGDSQDFTSYVIDAKTGEATTYAGPPEDTATNATRLLYGDKILTTDAGRPAIVDITTGKTVWRTTDKRAFLKNGGGVVFYPVAHENEGTLDLDERITFGIRATDTDSGKTLWTKEGTSGDFDIVGEDLITSAFENSKGDDDPLQVFDWRTGKGRWQVDSGELIGHTSDFYVFKAGRSRDEDVITVVSKADPHG